MAQTLRITQVRSPIGIKPKQRGTLRALGLRRINHTVELPDRPEIRGMVGTRAAPREGGRDHDDQDPRPPARAGLPHPGAPRRPRHRRQGRQDRGPRHEGPARPRHREARVRGWSDAAARRTPKAKGFKNPFRVEYAVVNLDTLEAFDAGTEVDPGDAPVARSRRQARPREGARPRASSRRRSPCAPTRSPRPRSGRSKAPVAASSACRCRGRPASPRRGERPHQPVSSATPAARGGRAPPCSPACGTCSGCPTCGTRSSSRSDHRRDLPGRRPPPGAVRRLQRDQGPAGAGRDTRRRRRLPRPVLRRRDHQRRDLLPRDHAVHHGVDHHAAARRRDPEARAVAARGPGRAEEDHAVDPLPHGRRSRSCSRPASCSRCTRATAACSASPASRAATSSPTSPPRGPRSSCSRGPPVPPCVMWLGRAHHPARHRQRHVDPDLRVGRVAPPCPGRRRSTARAASSSSSRSSPSASR